MTKVKENRLLIKSVLNACENLNIDVKYLFASLDLESALKETGNSKLQKEDIELLVKFIQVYRFIDRFCGGDVHFIHHWVITKNKYFDTTPMEFFYTRDGIQRMYEYAQRFN